MNLHSLPQTTARAKKRRGQGYGSGKGGHTSGRGQKGQRSRGGISLWFEGGQLPQIRRFPFVRGKRRFVSLKPQVIEINLGKLAALPADTQVTPKTLFQAGLIEASALKSGSIKILGHGQLSVPLQIALPVSRLAEKKIIAAGGKVSRGDHQ